MYDPDNNFAPELVDQQIEQPDAGLPRGEARLVHELQAMYDREKRAAIDRVWERMAQNPSAAHPRSDPPSRQPWQREPVRSFPMQQIDRTTKPAKRLTRTLSLVAAALICAVLVGSLALILAVRPGTQTGSSIHRNSSSPTAATPHAELGKTLFVYSSLKTGPDHFMSVGWSSNGKYISVSGTDIKLLNAFDG
jgi:hypothetical protein